MSDNTADQSKYYALYTGLTVIRGVLLITLGVVLLITDKTPTMLFNAMGLFWLIAGIIIFRQNMHRTGHRLLRVFAVVAVITGTLVITRELLRPFITETLLFGILGGIILLKGILALSIRYKMGHRSLHGRRLLNTLLGTLEIILGVLLLLAGFNEDLFFTSLVYVAIIWALLGGVSLLVSVLLQRWQPPEHLESKMDTNNK